MLQQQKNIIDDFTLELGRAGLHYAFPNDFEYYAIAFEIIDNVGDSVAYFGFPIMPNSLNISISNAINISQTSAGVESIINPAFIPFDVTGLGTFGRALKFVNYQQAGIGLRLSKKFFSSKLRNIENIIDGNGANFSDFVKTGYGLCKVLEKIFALGSAVDSEGRPYISVMYNLSMNHNYIVDLLNISFSQDVSTNNAMWNYNFTIKATAPLKALNGFFENKKSPHRIIRKDITRNSINTLGSIFRRYTPQFLKFG